MCETYLFAFLRQDANLVGEEGEVVTAVTLCRMMVACPSFSRELNSFCVVRGVWLQLWAQVLVIPTTPLFSWPCLDFHRGGVASLCWSCNYKSNWKGWWEGGEGEEEVWVKSAPSCPACVWLTSVTPSCLEAPPDLAACPRMAISTTFNWCLKREKMNLYW